MIFNGKFLQGFGIYSKAKKSNNYKKKNKKLKNTINNSNKNQYFFDDHFFANGYYKNIIYIVTPDDFAVDYHVLKELLGVPPHGYQFIILKESKQYKIPFQKNIIKNNFHPYEIIEFSEELIKKGLINNLYIGKNIIIYLQDNFQDKEFKIDSHIQNMMEQNPVYDNHLSENKIFNKKNLTLFSEALKGTSYINKSKGILYKDKINNIYHIVNKTPDIKGIAFNNVGQNFYIHNTIGTANALDPLLKLIKMKNSYFGVTDLNFLRKIFHSNGLPQEYNIDFIINPHNNGVLLHIDGQKQKKRSLGKVIFKDNNLSFLDRIITRILLYYNPSMSAEKLTSALNHSGSIVFIGKEFYKNSYNLVVHATKEHFPENIFKNIIILSEYDYDFINKLKKTMGIKEGEPYSQKGLQNFISTLKKLSGDSSLEPNQTSYSEISLPIKPLELGWNWISMNNFMERIGKKGGLSLSLFQKQNRSNNFHYSAEFVIKFSPSIRVFKSLQQIPLTFQYILKTPHFIGNNLLTNEFCFLPKGLMLIDGIVDIVKFADGKIKKLEDLLNNSKKKKDDELTREAEENLHVFKEKKNLLTRKHLMQASHFQLKDEIEWQITEKTKFSIDIECNSNGVNDYEKISESNMFTKIDHIDEIANQKLISENKEKNFMKQIEESMKKQLLQDHKAETDPTKQAGIQKKIDDLKQKIQDKETQIKTNNKKIQKFFQSRKKLNLKNRMDCLLRKPELLAKYKKLKTENVKDWKMEQYKLLKDLDEPVKKKVNDFFAPDGKIIIALNRNLISSENFGSDFKISHSISLNSRTEKKFRRNRISALTGASGEKNDYLSSIAMAAALSFSKLEDEHIGGHTAVPSYTLEEKSKKKMIFEKPFNITTLQLVKLIPILNTKSLLGQSILAFYGAVLGHLSMVIKDGANFNWEIWIGILISIMGSFMFMVCLTFYLNEDGKLQFTLTFKQVHLVHSQKMAQMMMR